MSAVESALALGILRGSAGRGNTAQPPLSRPPGGSLLCTVMRCRLQSMGLAGSCWITDPCDTPLFTDAERAAGECSSCASGWTHPHNYRVRDYT